MSTSKLVIIRRKIQDVFLTVSDEQMYFEVMNIFLEALESEFGVFGYIDENDGFVVPSMTSHIWDQCEVSHKEYIFPRESWGDSSWPRAIREKKGNYTNRKSESTPEGHIPILRHISMPIIFRDQVIGAVQVANKKTDYTDADFHTLKEICNIIAPILSSRLNRARAQQESERIRDELFRQKIIAENERKLSELKTRFMTTATHEIRTPLTSMLGYIELIETAAKDQDISSVYQFLDVVKKYANRLSALTDDLLDLQRLEADRIILNIEPLVVTSFVKDVISEIRPLFNGK